MKSSRANKLTKLVAFGGLSVGVPACAAFLWPQLLENPALGLLAILLYELALFLVALLGQVANDLQMRWMKRAAESLDARIQRFVSRYTSACLAYIYATTRYMDEAGLSTRGEYTLETSDIYVSLALDARPAHSIPASVVPQPLPTDFSRVTVSDDTLAHVRPNTIWHWIEQAEADRSPLAVVGPPGCGKTTLLRHVANVMARGGKAARRYSAPSKIPVVINLRDHRALNLERAPNLAHVIRSVLAIVPKPEPAGWVESNLQAGRLALLFDGLDEIPDPMVRKKVVDWIGQQAGAHSANLMVVTSRPFGYRENPINGAIVLRVRPFGLDQIHAFVRSWYRASTVRAYGELNDSARIAATEGARRLIGLVSSSSTLSELASNPLLLTMIANVHQYRGALPGSRSDLYREICEVFLGKRHEARGIPLESSASKKRVVLQSLAHYMMASGMRDISDRDALDVIQAPLARVAESQTATDFLRDIEETSGLLIERERGTYSFAHLTFQEYLCAQHMIDTKSSSELIARVGDPWWHEVILLYSADSDATEIVNACFARGGPALLALAMQCSREAREVAPTVRSSLMERLNPSDVLTNKESRERAALTHLYMRQSMDDFVRPGRYISSRPISNLEYQYFIDSQGDSFIPDHWTSNTFRGLASDPVRGIRRSDAVRFCEWLSTLNETEYRYALPRVSDLAGDAPVQPGGLPSACWVDGPQPTSTYSRFWPLPRTYGEARRYVPYPAVSPFPAHLLDRYMERDQEAIDRAISGGCCSSENHSPDFMDRVHIHIPLEHFTPVVAADFQVRNNLLNELLRDIGSDTGGCDVGQTVRDIELVAVLAKGFIDEFASEPNESSALERNRQEMLRWHCTQLQRCADTALDRGAYARRKDTTYSNARFAARVSALATIHACVSLHEARYGEFYHWPINRLVQSASRPSRLPAVTTAVLTRALAAIYLDLLILEMRLDDVTVPSEELVYVRMEGAVSAVEELGRDLASVVRVESHGLWPKMKPLADAAVATLFMLLSAPVLVVIGLVVAASSPGPLFSVQTRIGRYGKPFRQFQFRTMYVDGARRVAPVESDRSDGPPMIGYKTKSDPRVTAVGRVLRRTDLHELPQLFNVVRGEMSIVGPRAPLLWELELYLGSYAKRLSVRPGLVGPWQVSGRSDLSFDEAAEMELRYVDTLSLRNDVRLMIAAVPAAVRGVGRYS